MRKITSQNMLDGCRTFVETYQCIFNYGPIHLLFGLFYLPSEFNKLKSTQQTQLQVLHFTSDFYVLKTFLLHHRC